MSIVAQTTSDQGDGDLIGEVVAEIQVALDRWSIAQIGLAVAWLAVAVALEVLGFSLGPVLILVLLAVVALLSANPVLVVDQP